MVVMVVAGAVGVVALMVVVVMLVLRLLGLVLGAIVLLILRACWPTPSGSTQTKE